MATSIYSDAKHCNVFIVIVPLFVDSGFDPDFGILENALRSVGGILKPGDLVVLETIVPPGTTDVLALGLVGRVKWLEGRRLPPRVLSGEDNDWVQYFSSKRVSEGNRRRRQIVDLWPMASTRSSSPTCKRSQLQKLRSS